MGQLIELTSEQRLIEKIRTLFKENLSDSAEVSFENFCDALCNDTCSERLFEFLFKNYLRNMEGSRNSEFEPTLFHENLSNISSDHSSTTHTIRLHRNLVDQSDFFGAELHNLDPFSGSFDSRPFQVFEYSDSRPSQASFLSHSDLFLRSSSSSSSSREPDNGSIMTNASNEYSSLNPIENYQSASLSDRTNRFQNHSQSNRIFDPRRSTLSRRHVSRSLNHLRQPYAIPDRLRSNGDPLPPSTVHQPYVSFALTSPYVSNFAVSENAIQTPGSNVSQVRDSGHNL